MKYLNYVSLASSEKVIQKWHESEQKSPKLVDFVQQQGHTVQTYRADSIELLNLRNRAWHIYQINDLEFLRRAQPGPYPGWHKVFDKYDIPIESRTFDELAKKAQEWGLKHNRIPDIMEHFPLDTQLMAMDFSESEGKIEENITEPDTFIIDGSHRIFSLLLAAEIGKTIDLNQIRLTIAIALCPKNEREMITNVLKAKQL